jgi:arylsulfatase A-like enzyme
MQIPLVVRAPGIGGGERTAGLTESIDIYPTLCELAGTETPQHVQGRSFVPLLREPSREWKPAAVGRYRNGDTVRTDAYRYTEYSRRDGDVVARMLYDHEQDPKETRNVAGQETLQPVVQRLSDTLSERMGRADSQRSTEN